MEGDFQMNHRERAMAVLNDKPYDRLPIVHFGFWGETLAKWSLEGHITEDLVKTWGDGNPTDARISEILGFDFNLYSAFHPNAFLRPEFEPRVIEVFPDGRKHIRNNEGVTLVQEPEAGSIPAEIDHLLKDRASWEEHYKHRLTWHEERVTKASVRVNDRMLPFDQGGLDFLKANQRDYPYGLHCGSLYGVIRNVIGMENLCYLQADDEALYDEIIQTVADLSYHCVEYTLKSGARFDFAHFWEDICFKNGPLVSPAVFLEKVGPHYKRITDLIHQYGLNIVSLDCDGMIDALIPTWLQNGVNTMFPIEVGTWNANIRPWRERYGKELRGVGGMNKTVFAHDKAAIDAEIERLKGLVALGGYIPCPDHRIAPDAKFELVRYYCDRMRKIFG